MTKKVNFKQLGTSGLYRSGGYVFEEFLPDLRFPRAAKVYKEMADNDATVGSILYLAEMLIRKVDWSVKPASDDAEDIAAAEFLRTCMDDMSNSWASTINEILSMFTYGFSFHEIVYKLRKGHHSNPQYYSDYTDGRVGWRKIAPRAQDTIVEWEFDDEDGDIVAVYQSAPPMHDRVRIPLTKGLLFRTRVNKDNPEGKSLLRNAYRAWYFKKKIEEIEAIGIERDLAGLPMLTAPEDVDIWDDENPENTALRVNAETLVTNIRRDATEGVLLPFGWKLELASTGGSRQFDTNAIINRYDNRIAITMLSDMVLMGSDKAGSFAMADTKKSILASSLEAHLANIVDVFNSYAVPDLFSHNTFKITKYPKIVAGQIETPDIKELSLLLRSMGLDIQRDAELQNFIRNLASLPLTSQEQIDTLYPAVPTEQPTDTKGRKVDDTVDNDFEQNELYYNGNK